MRTRTLRLAVPLVIVVAAAAAALARGDGEGAKPEDTVKALRFRQLIVESGLDFAHGGGRWHDVLFLPDTGLVAQVVWETEITANPEVKVSEFPRMHVFPGTLEDQLAARPKDDAQAKPPEEIRIPASLAKEIAELAELTKRHKDLGLRLGKSAVDAKAVGGRDSVKFR